MKMLTSVDPAALLNADRVAKSNEFAIYRLGHDTFVLVQQHEGTEWQGVTFSGDGLFRVSELLAAAARTLYRSVASRLIPEPAPADAGADDRLPPKPVIE